jgi:TPR repeat protein
MKFLEATNLKFFDLNVSNAEIFEDRCSIPFNIGFIAKRDIGICRLFRQGKKPREEAAKWFHKACKHGSSTGCSGIAMYHREGKGGVAKDGAKAAKLFRKALRLPDNVHQGIDLIYLADLYKRGEGVPKDLVLAQMWLEIAESKGAIDYRYSLTSEIREYLEVMSPADFDEAALKAKRCVASHYRDCD